MTNQVETESIRRYTEEDLRATIKPLPRNGFARFFVQIYRRCMEWWYAFSDRHAKGAELIQKVCFFLVFSMGVSIWQYVVMTFLPYAFASLNDGAWGWPNIPIAAAGGNPYMIFGDAQGLGYFIAFEIAVFTAQCINFPLQRNVTYRSHGNVFIQAMWYFIGWLAVSVLTSALWGICNVFLIHWKVPDAVTGIGKTFLTGTLSMVVFFFIFMIIFPNNEKITNKTKARCEKARARGQSVKVIKLEVKLFVFERRAQLDKTERIYAKAASDANTAVMRYFALKRNGDETEEEFAERKQLAFDRAVEAIEEQKRAQSEYFIAKMRVVQRYFSQVVL